jgi:LSD1 subclass zinc finger protein
MGTYAINCPSCGTSFTWFSGDTDQRCSSCKAAQISVTVQPKPKRHQNQRLSHVEPTWIRRAALTILQRKIKQLLELGKQGDFKKDDMEFLIKAIEASRKLEKDSVPTDNASAWSTEVPNED